MKKSELTVIVPFYNEEKTLDIAVSNLVESNFVSEILLVNDGSTDSSHKLATNLAKKDEQIKVIESEQNLGKGNAVKLGITNASEKYIGILDADLEYSPNDLRTLYLKTYENKLDITCGSRFIGNDKRDNLYIRTYLANKLLSKLFSIIYRKKVTDIATCLKVFKKDIFKELILESNGFEIEVELLAKALKKSNKYDEIPIKYSARSYKDGKKIKFSDGFKYLSAMFKYR